MRAKTGRKQDGRFKKGYSGNPSGRRRGSRNKATIALDQLIEGEGEAIVRAMIERAIGGDMTAAKPLLDRLVPPRKQRPVCFDLEPVRNAEEAHQALATVIQTAAQGKLDLNEARDVTALLERYIRTCEAADFESRLIAIESKLSGN